MSTQDSKNIILERIRKSSNKDGSFTNVEVPEVKDFFKKSDLPFDKLFKQELEKVSGNCTICDTKDELLKSLFLTFNELKINSIFCIDKELQVILREASIPFTEEPDEFINMEAGFTSCEYLIARLGTVMISSKQVSGRRMNIFPPVHIVLGLTSQLVYDLDEAINKIRDKYQNELPSLITVITGPSRTADIEKTLVLGAHGPKQVFVFLLKEDL